MYVALYNKESAVLIFILCQEKLHTIKYPTLPELVIACLLCYVAISESQSAWDSFYTENFLYYSTHLSRPHVLVQDKCERPRFF